jgi:chromosome partitioning protein
MSVIVFSSSKSGCGKTTSSAILGTELAQSGGTVAMLDADPNKNLMDWSKLPGAPANLKVVGDIAEENIVDHIEAARADTTAFVIVDLEGTASLMVSYAISLADLVIVPMQGSQLDAKQAARQMKLIQAQGRIAGRTIPFTMLLTRTHPAISPRTQRHIETRFAELQVPVLNTRLADREAYRAMFSYGGTLIGLAGRHVSNLDLAIKNARMFAGEVLKLLRVGSETKEAAVA